MKKILRSIVGCCCLKTENPKNEEEKAKQVYEISSITNQNQEPLNDEKKIQILLNQQPEQISDQNQQEEKQFEDTDKGFLKPNTVIKRKYPPKVNIGEIRDTLRKSESNIIATQNIQNAQNTLKISTQEKKGVSENDVQVQVVQQKSKQKEERERKKENGYKEKNYG